MWELPVPGVGTSGQVRAGPAPVVLDRSTVQSAKTDSSPDSDQDLESRAPVRYHALFLDDF